MFGGVEDYSYLCAIKQFKTYKIYGNHRQNQRDCSQRQSR